MPPKAQELSAKASETRDIEFNFDENTLVARPVVSAGQLYIYVAHITRPPFQPSLQSLGMRLLVILVIGGIFCYWLARYLATPLFKLRTTTNELAEGNLGACFY